MVDYTPEDYRMALYFEHYDAGGAFDYISPEEYRELELRIDEVREYVKEHGLPAGLDVSP